MTKRKAAISAADVVAEIVAAPSTADFVALVERLRRQEPRVIHIHAPFGDGVYRMTLGMKEVAELQRVCGYADKHGVHQPLGIGAIYGRLARGRAFLPSGEADWAHMDAAEALASEIVERDCIETIRLALIGGAAGLVDGERVKVDPVRAKQLIDTYVAGQPLENAWTYAFAILSARITGVAPNDFGDEMEKAA